MFACVDRSTVSVTFKNEYVMCLKCSDVETSTHVVDILDTKNHPMFNEVEKFEIN